MWPEDIFYFIVDHVHNLLHFLKEYERLLLSCIIVLKKQFGDEIQFSRRLFMGLGCSVKMSALTL